MLEIKDDFEELEAAEGECEEEEVEPDMMETGAFELLEQLYLSNSYNLEPLIQALYDLPDHAVEAILPQLCHLYQIWPEWKSAELGPWFVYKCCKSVHLALRIIWWVSASSHFTTPERKVKCLKLVDDCEMSLVNAEIINDGLSPRLTRKRVNSRSRLRRFLPPQSQPTAQQQQQNPGSPVAASTGLRIQLPSSADSSMEQPEASSPISVSTPVSKLEVENAIRAKVSAGLQFNQLEQDEQRALLVSMRDKHLRSEYFNAHLSLITVLDQASESLAKISRKNGQRQAQLSAFVDALNRSQIKGLYFPGLKVRDPHYRVIRILESRCLSSRDKAPFVLNIEVVGTGHRCGDPDIYSHYGQEVDEQLSSTLAPPLAGAEGSIPEGDSEDADDGQDREDRELEREQEERLRLQQRDEAAQPGSQIGPLSSPLSHASQQAQEKQQPPPQEDEEKAAAEDDQDGLVGQSFSFQRTPRSTSLRRSSSSSGTSAPSSPSQTGPARFNTVRLPPPGHRRNPDSPLNRDYSHNVGDKLAQQEISQIFGHPWNATVHNFALISPHSMLPNWNMLSVIYKAGDDCRQEVLAMQLINIFHDVFTRAQLPLKLRPYFTLVTSHASGVIETVSDTMSVDGIKRKLGGKFTLRQFVEKAFGKSSEMLDRAKRNFTESMAAYSIVSYLLQIKDRHNGNILMDSEGHLIHVDFGFMLSNTPGNVCFETAPFKLTREYLEVMDGESSALFSYFKLLVVKGFLEIRKYAQRLLLLVEIMSHDSQMPCFQGLPSPADVVDAFRDRFMLHMPQADCMRHVMSLVDQSVSSWRASQYDTYQRLTNGIL